MKVFTVLFSVCITFALDEDCRCQEGLVCTVTKQLIKMGEVMPVKQCMPEGEKIEIETVDLDEEDYDSPMRNKRWLWFNRCSNDSDCTKNFCCAFGRRCAPKLFKYFTCSLQDTVCSHLKLMNQSDFEVNTCSRPH